MQISYKHLNYLVLSISISTVFRERFKNWNVKFQHIFFPFFNKFCHVLCLERLWEDESFWSLYVRIFYSSICLWNCEKCWKQLFFSYFSCFIDEIKKVSYSVNGSSWNIFSECTIFGPGDVLLFKAFIVFLI